MSMRKLFAILMLAVALVQSAGAQQISLADLQARLGGSWTATVEGENRTRVLVIDAVAQKGEGVFIITGTFNFTDQKPFNFKNGEVQTSSGNTTVLFTTAADSVYVGSLKADGTVVGTTKYKNGQEKGFKLEKGAVAVAAAAAARPIAEFDGKWTGNSTATSINCVNGVYDLTIKDGRVSGTVVFSSRLGPATSVVTGQARPDKTLALALARQVDFGRNSRFTVSLDGDQFKGRDQVSGGACTYDVVLKKG